MMDEGDPQKIKILPTDQEKEFGSVWRKWITRKISQEKSATTKPKWRNLLDSNLRRKLKKSEGENQLDLIEKQLNNGSDLIQESKMAQNSVVAVDDGDEPVDRHDYIQEELRGKLPNPIKVPPKFHRTFSLPEDVQNFSSPVIENVYIPSKDYCPYLDKPPRKKRGEIEPNEDGSKVPVPDGGTGEEVVVIPEKDYCPYLDKAPRPQTKQNDFEVRKWILKNETGEDEELQVFFQDNNSLKERRVSVNKTLAPRSNSLPDISFTRDKPPKWMELMDMKLGFGDFPDIDSIAESNVETEITEVKQTQSETIEPEVFKVSIL
jgi:hypothetical protein